MHIWYVNHILKHLLHALMLEQPFMLIYMFWQKLLDQMSL